MTQFKIFLLYEVIQAEVIQGPKTANVTADPLETIRTVLLAVRVVGMSIFIEGGGTVNLLFSYRIPDSVDKLYVLRVFYSSFN